MIRLKTATGYFLVTHRDHARLAAEFARHWGNALFMPPAPRRSVLYGIGVHDDGWAARDAAPSVTREGRPSAFSVDLVGTYSAFEEIDLAAYLAVREEAVALVEGVDAYAALLVTMHTYNLLTERADRATIALAQLPLLDAFLERQRARRQRLLERLQGDAAYTAEATSEAGVLQNFRLLQACDNLSLLSCVAYGEPATLLHPLATVCGEQRVEVVPLGLRRFRLEPWPFDRAEVVVAFPARHVDGHVFASSQALAEAYAVARVEKLEAVLTACG
jgi:hypothetical protein